MTTTPPVLYLIICGVSGAHGSYDLIRDLRSDGWDVCVITTPMGSRFINVEHVAALTGHPVRSDYKRPEDADVLPAATAYVVAPASFNTVNKIANGISDTLAVGIVCEAIGKGQPVLITPWMNRALANHGAYARSLDCLAADGVELLLTSRTQPQGLPDDPGGKLPWADILTWVRGLQSHE